MVLGCKQKPSWKVKPSCYKSSYHDEIDIFICDDINGTLIACSEDVMFSKQKKFWCSIDIYRYYFYSPWMIRNQNCYRHLKTEQKRIHFVLNFLFFNLRFRFMLRFIFEKYWRGLMLNRAKYRTLRSSSFVTCSLSASAAGLVVTYCQLLSSQDLIVNSPL